jgi:hypothetical protein
MRTFALARDLVPDPHYADRRDQAMAALSLQTIDAPIRHVIGAFARLDICFTLQSCRGHFLHAEQNDPHNLEPLPAHDVGTVKYRIAYLAVCIQQSPGGMRLRSLLQGIPEIDPEYVQFGSPQWFWQRHPNSYALQVEPERFKNRDVAVMDHQEALHVMRVRDCFFDRICRVVQTFPDEYRAAQ